MSDEANTLVWDDTLLMKTYDDSVNLAREALARRLAGNTNTPDGEADDGEAAAGVADNKTESVTNASITPEVVFKVGDYARATYIDGIDYEGFIISIDKEAGACILRYCGYENEQEVLLTDLVPSWGKKTRREQFLQAKVEREQEQSRSKNVSRKPTAPKKMGSGNSAAGSSLVVPPMPFVPPLMNSNVGDGEQDFVAMLTAWYMSGYYTGYYQGKKEAAAASNKKNHAAAAGAVKK